ncbi:Uncharacterized protein dnm_033040 [Desulfonema magnum]|uniref:Uncharacterized protein n=1 Tax=Desulfonema magnum TaxID=45655 RepID=A0A975BKA4_9BACT|nr:Uncharacterized protein dnm_033040 [Desulfonema magnum]
MHQAKTAGRGLQPRPKRLFSGVGKYFGRGCKPRPADHELIKTMSYDLSLMHMGRNPICIRLRMRDGCRTGFATPSETFAGGDPENIPDGVANPVRQNQS